MYQAYKVLENDTLDSLAIYANTTVDEIIMINGLDDYSLRVGDMLVLPKNNNLYYDYVVKDGDSLYGISRMYGVDLNILVAINGLDEDDYIYPNQKLLIPRDDVNIYLTSENDTLDLVSDKMKISKSDIVNNSDLYLMPGQLIIYKSA